MVAHDPAQLTGHHRAAHGADRAGVQVGQQGDRLLAVERPDQLVADRVHQRRQLVRGERHLDLGVAHLGHLSDQVDQQAGRQRRAGHGRVLHHDRDVDGIGHGAEVVDHALGGHGQRGTEERRHQHDHGRAHVLGGAAALRGDPGAVVAGGHDHRHPAGGVLQHGGGDLVALGLGQRELLRVVGQRAHAVDPGVDQVVEHPPQSGQVQVLVVVEDRGHDRDDAGQRG